MKIGQTGPGHSVARLTRCTKGLAAVEFALIAPILLLLIFAIIIYSLYFTVYMGVREAAAEGARAAVAGLSTSERTTLAQTRATAVMNAYSPIAGAATPTVQAEKAGTGLFRVRVTYNISGSPLMQYAFLLPMPAGKLQSEVIVANGSY